jgi:hypothetical protein
MARIAAVTGGGDTACLDGKTRWWPAVAETINGVGTAGRKVMNDCSKKCHVSGTVVKVTRVFFLME